ncbi:MAG: EscU/YscU/HrcU family type III secretion system export apparatus switch protein [Oceanospirillaceae bacterium]|nr:EscU/YscU/HrcU family type III secretion system export apparatus switch protein [Oceanospirillaceae bacterium]
MNREEKNAKVDAAVALKYDMQDAGVPTVVAKGHGQIAEKIIELARENDVHIHENPELLEILIRLEIGDEIPEALYRAIAEVIAFTYELKTANR